MCNCRNNLKANLRHHFGRGSRNTDVKIRNIPVAENQTQPTENAPSPPELHPQEENPPPLPQN